jgi:hypothetical protein
MADAVTAACNAIQAKYAAATPTESTPKRKGTTKGSRKKALATGEVIDMTLDDDGQLLDIVISGAEAGAGARGILSPKAGPSRLRDVTPIEENGVGAFRAIPRSLLSGLARRPSLSPTPSNSSRLGVDKKPSRRSRSPLINASRMGSPARDLMKGEVRKSSDHFEPPGLFSTNLMPEVIETADGLAIELKRPDNLTKPSTDDKSVPPQGLLLPDHVLVDDDNADSTLNPITNEAESSMAGLHFLDSDTSKGVTRYFDDEDAEQTEEAAFLAQADTSKLCMNCKRPGHRRNECTHFSVS